MTHEPGVYVARYGWNRRSGSLITGAAVFVLAGLTVPMSLALRVVAIVFFGGCALVFIAAVASRRVALQVDSNGITLGGSPVRYRSTICLIPWTDIEQIVLWRQAMPHGGSMRYISVDGRDGVLARAGYRGQRAIQPGAGAVVLGNRDGMLLARRAVNLWRLDAHQLAAAVSHFAPGVPVVDDTGSRR